MTIARFRFPEISGGGSSGRALRGRFMHNASMARHVSWRAGGIAQRIYVPADLDDLCLLLQGLDPGEPVHMVGLGSNLLVRDGGVKGVVVLLHGVLDKIAIESRTNGIPTPEPGKEDSGVIYAEAGVASPKLARFAANHDLVEAEFLAGVPGTVGGALAMNAGCYGSETWNHVIQVLTLDRHGHLTERRPDEYVVGYRHVALKDHAEEWFVGGWFRFMKGDGQASREQIKVFLRQRIATQPLQLPNAGSVFRNPPGEYAARLIEMCGLKGMRVGQAQVSTVHANFIVNLGGATAGDIESLIEKVEDVVEAMTNVRLMREVRIIGARK